MKDIICNAHYAPSYSRDFHFKITGRDEAETRLWEVQGTKAHWAAAVATPGMEEYARYVRHCKKGRSTAQEKRDARMQALKVKVRRFVGQAFASLLGAFVELSAAAERWGIEADELHRMLNEGVESAGDFWHARLGDILKIGRS